jgi:hypothetical protein
MIRGAGKRRRFWLIEDHGDHALMQLECDWPHCRSGECARLVDRRVYRACDMGYPKAVLSADSAQRADSGRSARRQGRSQAHGREDRGSAATGRHRRDHHDWRP